jgi:hypothetical protein
LEGNGRALIEVLSWFLLGGTEERLASILAEIQIEDFPYVNLRVLLVCQPIQ